MSTEHTHTSAQVDQALAQVDERLGEGGIINGAAEVLAAEVRRLRDERENWRVSSVAREAVARAEQAEAKIAQIAHRLDSMSSVQHSAYFTVGTLAILDDIHARHVSLTEGINDAEANIAALVAAGDHLRMKAHLYGLAKWHLAVAAWDAAKSSALPTP